MQNSKSNLMAALVAAFAGVDAEAGQALAPLPMPYPRQHRHGRSRLPTDVDNSKNVCAKKGHLWRVVATDKDPDVRGLLGVHAKCARCAAHSTEVGRRRHNEKRHVPWYGREVHVYP